MYLYHPVGTPSTLSDKMKIQNCPDTIDKYSGKRSSTQTGCNSPNTLQSSAQLHKDKNDRLGNIMQKS